MRALLYEVAQFHAHASGKEMVLAEILRHERFQTAWLPTLTLGIGQFQQCPLRCWTTRSAAPEINARSPRLR